MAYRGLVATGVGIVKEEGFRRLYRGLVPACLRHCVYSGIRVGVYEFLREHVFLKVSILHSRSLACFSFTYVW